MDTGRTSGAEKLQADIIVVGGGGAGLAAAVTAAENGVKNIILLEKRPVLGGNSVFPAGLLGTETQLQRRLGYDTRRDDIFRGMMEYSHWKVDARVIRALVDKTPDNIKWLEAKGIHFDKLVPLYANQIPLTYHYASGPEKTGALIIKALTKIAQTLGVRIMLQTGAKKIFTDGKGNVTGVVATARDKEVKISAKSVILATGGFAGNPELIKKFDSSYNERELVHGGIPHTGDATLMAAEIGAAIEGMVPDTEGPDFPWSGHLTVTAKRPNTIWVNKNGERFADENLHSIIEASNAIYRQPGRASYTLFDESVKTRITEEESTPFEALFLDNKPLQPGLDKELHAQAAKGRIKIANSWDEIAEWMGIPPEALKATINEYNFFCDHGHDDLFDKDPKYLVPLRTPPYYAIRCYIKLLTIHGGPRINHHMQVLNQQQEPIGGLYAAGDETGGIDSDSYNIFLSGHSFAFVLSSGRIAGENAARYIEQITK
jgi:fumarate reductase flavoprotein subunit